jgi:hypothetical protein
MSKIGIEVVALSAQEKARFRVNNGLKVVKINNGIISNNKLISSEQLGYLNNITNDITGIKSISFSGSGLIYLVNSSFFDSVLPIEQVCMEAHCKSS